MRPLLLIVALILPVAAWLLLRGESVEAGTLSPDAASTQTTRLPPRRPLEAVPIPARIPARQAIGGPALAEPGEAEVEGTTVLEGRVTVNDLPPGYSLRVALDTDQTAVRERREAAGFPDDTPMRSTWSGFTDADGRFAFVEVPIGWCGALRASSREGIELGGCELALQAPHPWIELNVTAPPIVRGRLLDPVTRAPVAGMMLKLEGGSLVNPLHVVTWSDGSFRTQLPAGSQAGLQPLRLVERSEPYTPGLSIDPLHLDPITGTDLGDLLAARTRPLEVHVHDPFSAHVPNARVSLEGHEQDAVHTDAGGRARIQRYATVSSRLRVEADGFEPRLTSSLPSTPRHGMEELDAAGNVISIEQPGKNDTNTLEVELQPSASPR